MQRSIKIEAKSKILSITEVVPENKEVQRLTSIRNSYKKLKEKYRLRHDFDVSDDKLICTTEFIKN